MSGVDSNINRNIITPLCCSDLFVVIFLWLCNAQRKIGFPYFQCCQLSICSTSLSAIFICIIFPAPFVKCFRLSLLLLSLMLFQILDSQQNNAWRKPWTTFVYVLCVLVVFLFTFFNRQLDFNNIFNELVDFPWNLWLYFYNYLLLIRFINCKYVSVFGCKFETNAWGVFKIRFLFRFKPIQRMILTILLVTSLMAAIIIKFVSFKSCSLNSQLLLSLMNSML